MADGEYSTTFAAGTQVDAPAGSSTLASGMTINNGIVKTGAGALRQYSTSGRRLCLPLRRKPFHSDVCSRSQILGFKFQTRTRHVADTFLINSARRKTRPMPHPNILFILTDDQGPWAMGCAGNTEVRTPNLDRLAAEGMRFESFFCTSPVCSPARASILTGRIPSQHGVHDFLHWGRYMPGATADETRFLADMPTSASILAETGYATCLSGKWHLGYGLEPQAGFERWHAMPYGGSDYYHPPLAENGEVVMHDGEYATDLYTDNALRFLDEAAGSEQPFCLHMHYTAPHSPWGREQHPVDLWDDYFHNCPFDATPDDPPPDFLSCETRDTAYRRSSLAGYYAALEAMDRNVGRLLDRLERHGLREDTLVVFMSDNGMNMGHHGLYGKGNASWPQNMFDPSVKVPCLISRPGHVPAGKVNSDLLSQYDWLPTLLDYLGLQDALPAGLPGRSFAPLLHGETLDGDSKPIVVFDEYGPVRMIRTQEWKLVWRYPAGPHELYHLAKDPDETRNLFDYRGNAEIVQSLRADLDAWFARYAVAGFDGKRLPVTGRGQLGPADRPNAFTARRPEAWRPSLNA